jgi:hypothetical protein
MALLLVVEQATTFILVIISDLIEAGVRVRGLTRVNPRVPGPLVSPAIYIATVSVMLQLVTEITLYTFAGVGASTKPNRPSGKHESNNEVLHLCHVQ